MRKISIGVTTDQLRRAITVREQIDSLEQELASLLGGQSRRPGRPPSGRRRRRAAVSVRRGKPRGQRKMSAAGRRRISEAAKARWARFRDKQK